MKISKQNRIYIVDFNFKVKLELLSVVKYWNGKNR